METASNGPLRFQMAEWASGMPMVVNSMKLSNKASVNGRDMSELKTQVPDAMYTRMRIRQQMGGQKVLSRSRMTLLDVDVDSSDSSSFITAFIGWWNSSLGWHDSSRRVVTTAGDLLLWSRRRDSK